MNNILFFEVPQCLQDLDREPSDQAQAHTLEIVSFDELIQIDAEKFKRYD